MLSPPSGHPALRSPPRGTLVVQLITFFKCSSVIIYEMRLSNNNYCLKPGNPGQAEPGLLISQFKLHTHIWRERDKYTAQAKNKKQFSHIILKFFIVTSFCSAFPPFLLQNFLPLPPLTSIPFRQAGRFTHTTKVAIAHGKTLRISMRISICVDETFLRVDKKGCGPTNKPVPCTDTLYICI